MNRKRLRLALVAALVLSVGGLLAPSALASLGGPQSAGPSLRATTDDTKPPVIQGRENSNRNSADNGSGCFYPPTRNPKIKLDEPDDDVTRKPTLSKLKVQIKVSGCGIAGMQLTLWRSSPSTPWTTVTTVESDAKGRFTFTDIPLDKGMNRFQVFSTPKYGLSAATSKVVDIRRK